MLDTADTDWDVELITFSDESEFGKVSAFFVRCVGDSVELSPVTVGFWAVVVIVVVTLLPVVGDVEIVVASSSSFNVNNSSVLTCLLYCVELLTGAYVEEVLTSSLYSLTIAFRLMTVSVLVDVGTVVVVVVEEGSFIAPNVEDDVVVDAVTGDVVVVAVGLLESELNGNLILRFLILSLLSGLWGRSSSGRTGLGVTPLEYSPRNEPRSFILPLCSVVFLVAPLTEALGTAEPKINGSALGLDFTFTRNLSQSLEFDSRALRNAPRALSPFMISLFVSLLVAALPSLQGLAPCGLIIEVGKSLISRIFSAFSLSSASANVAPKFRFLMWEGFGSSIVVACKINN